MKLTAKSDQQLAFQLTTREKDVLGAILNLYPIVPVNHQPLTKSGQIPEPDSNQRLLEESLAEHRAELMGRISRMMVGANSLTHAGGVWRLSLTPGEFESLLQTLNDVRVGSWIRLGSPELPLDEVNEQAAPHVWAMEMAGLLQMNFLGLVESSS